MVQGRAGGHRPDLPLPGAVRQRGADHQGAARRAVGDHLRPAAVGILRGVAVGRSASRSLSRAPEHVLGSKTGRKIPLLVAPCDHHIKRHARGQQQMADGHARRRPHGQQHADVHGMGDPAVEEPGSEAPWRRGRAAAPGLHLLDAEQIKDAEGEVRQTAGSAILRQTATQIASRRGERNDHTSMAIGCHRRIRAKRATLAAWTNVQRSNAGGMRPMNLVLNQGLAISECCRPKRLMSARSVRAALAGDRSRPPRSTVGSGQSRAAHRGLARNRAKHTQNAPMTMKPTHAYKGPNRRAGWASQSGDVSAMGNPFGANNDHLCGAVPVARREATPRAALKLANGPSDGSPCQWVGRRQSSLRGDRADQPTARSPLRTGGLRTPPGGGLESRLA